jgi:hypothetical protein
MPTEAKDIFEANSRNVRELLSESGLGLYIPPYQRPYGWDKDKVNKLLEDTLHGYSTLLTSEESFTFLGTVITIHDINFTTVQPIVRTEVPAKVLTVIDGQQRLTTLLIFCLALHNLARLSHAKMLKVKNGSLTAAETWLDGQARRVIEELASTFYQKQPYGDSPFYPRMIRSFDDQWSRSKSHAKYTSPIAHLISKYLTIADAEKPTEFKPQKREGRIEGEDALVERFSQLSKLLKSITATSGNGRRDELLEDMPTIQEIAHSKMFQRALINHEFPDEVVTALTSMEATAEFIGLLHLVLLACYALNRVAVTVVRGKNEDYAFTVFESLNTTGEPLTAFETFKPRVVSAEGIEHFENSQSRVHLSEVSNYLSAFKVGDALQEATRDLLIFFASAETGAKLSKRLADQRRYLKEEFERYEQVEAERVAFVRHLRDMTSFIQHCWVPSDKSPTLSGLPVEATTDVVKLCLAFLRELKHTVVIAPLLRFYSEALLANDGDRPTKVREFEVALKAMTAFSALWRASHRGTASIDQEYREILAGNNSLTALPPLSRNLKRGADASAPNPIVNVEQLKAELRARLSHAEHGGIENKDQFVAEASAIPAYQNNRPVTRFVLLAAYHDAIEDSQTPGLVQKGRDAVSPCLTWEGFGDERHLSLEHIAPQQGSQQWQAAIYENKEIVHRIGNLVLVQDEANSSLSSRPWTQKRVLYRALGTASSDEAAEVIANAAIDGIEYGESTKTIVALASHMPHLIALGTKTDDWTSEFIETRSRRLLDLAWDRLYAWMN